MTKSGFKIAAVNPAFTIAERSETETKQSRVNPARMRASGKPANGGKTVSKKIGNMSRKKAGRKSRGK